MNRFQREIRGRGIPCRHCGLVMGPITNKEQELLCPEGHRWRFQFKKDAIRMEYLGFTPLAPTFESPTIEASPVSEQSIVTSPTTTPGTIGDPVEGMLSDAMTVPGTALSSSTTSDDGDERPYTSPEGQATKSPWNQDLPRLDYLDTETTTSTDGPDSTWVWDPQGKRYIE